MPGRQPWAALAADLITGFIFKHLERNLAKQTARKAHLSEFGRASVRIIIFVFLPAEQLYEAALRS